MQITDIFIILSHVYDYNAAIGTLEEGVDVTFAADDFHIGDSSGRVMLDPWVKKTIFPFSDLEELARDTSQELAALIEKNEESIRRAVFLN